MEKKTAELWIKIIGIVGIVMAAIGVLAGIAMLVGGSFFGSLVSMFVPDLGIFGSGLIGSLFMVFGVIIIILDAFLIYTYVNLMKYVGWARIVVMVFAALGVIGGLTSLPSGILGLVINGGIFYLLMWQKEVVALFK
jgi:hypothetical protein